jgi:DNA-binding XRE family transcriptional regulator
MTSYNYREQDYSFGQIVLSLRTTTGLTQAALADLLDVSRRTIGSWEAGSKYPKVDHLKQFITIAFKHHAFPEGAEAAEIRALWQAARQKVFLDESWLVGILAQNQKQTAENQSIEQFFQQEPLASLLSISKIPEKNVKETPSSITGASFSNQNGSVVDWGGALALDTFYGREWELKLLTEWMIDQRCRIVTVLGMGGLGKSALSVNIMQQLAGHFDFVVWRSLRDLTNCDWLLNDLIQVFNPQAHESTSISFEQRMSVLMEQLRRSRILLVLDNLESALEQGERAGRLLPDFEGFGRFLRHCAERGHQSCVLLTSREKPAELIPFEGSRSPVRVLRLARLEPEACAEILAEKEVVGSEVEKARLIEAYAGNPLALKIVAQTIVELFNSEIAPFLEQGEIIFGNIRDLLDEQFGRLSAVERGVLMWLTILREPVTLPELDRNLIIPIPRSRMLETVEALRRRSLLESGQKKGSFALHSVILEYVTNHIIVETSREIQDGKLNYLLKHGLELAQAREYIRKTQERLIPTQRDIPHWAQWASYPRSSSVRTKLPNTWPWKSAST